MKLFKKAKTADVVTHYDALIDEGNDPVYDPEPLKEYMDKWDGKEFIDALGLTKNESVLEIGVGTGRLAVRTAPLCKSLTGIDISAKTVEVAKGHLACFSNVNLICADFLLWQPERSFDVIYSSLTFMHFEDKAKAIAHATGLLSKGGRLVISIDKNQDKYIDAGSRRVRIYPDTPENIEYCMKNAGLQIKARFELPFSYVIIGE
ncbi:MAG: class I SAM-dependent methyltransferase [Clostridia bacterium]|nr:class I SAM-dependent methyltransferase [Clostridia bacterium]